MPTFKDHEGRELTQVEGVAALEGVSGEDRSIQVSLTHIKGITMPEPKKGTVVFHNHSLNYRGDVQEVCGQTEAGDWLVILHTNRRVEIRFFGGMWVSIADVPTY